MPQPKITLGLKENWRQFTLLVVVNAFVGGMVGLERSIFPRFAELQFGISSAAAVLSFIIAFGLAKAITNYFTGRLANKFGRKNLLIAGWVIALPVPLLLIYAPSWNWVVFANLLLGIHQGLTWSSTVVMKIDLVGEKKRGLAMGLNEFSGYLAVGVIALLTGWIADDYGVTPYPFYLGMVLAVLGLFFTVFLIKDTSAHAQMESSTSEVKKLDNVFMQTTFLDKTLSSVSQAGLVNNMNDGMIWGLLPILLFTKELNPKEIALVAAVYPFVWGVGQLFTGSMSDRLSKKKMIFVGMLMQSIGIVGIPFSNDLSLLVIESAIIGLGTALVYPTFLSTIAGATSPLQRAESIGVFRLWRDLGYVFGALLSGIVADLFGVPQAIFLVAIITFISAVVVQLRMPRQ
jgi:MFS family permease